MSYRPLNLKKNYDQERLASTTFILKKEPKSAQKQVEKRPVIWTGSALQKKRGNMPFGYSTIL